ncbi:MAG: hypothetical protein WC043_09985 [Pseudobdellovibrionaceae bacterium]
MIPNATSPPARSPAFTLQSGQNDRMAGSVPVFGDLIKKTETPPSPNVQTANFAAQETPAPVETTAQESFGLDDIVDIINPLQHLPLVGILYRTLTGDTISAAAGILGGALYGGPVGAGLAIAGTVAKDMINGEASSTKTASALRDPAAHITQNTPDNASVTLANLRGGLTPYNS